MLVFDVSNRQTFQHVVQWVEELKSYHTDPLCIFMVGNKIESDSREVTADEAQQLANEMGVR
jgi:GTPase SAR1 family protein